MIIKNIFFSLLLFGALMSSRLSASVLANYAFATDYSNSANAAGITVTTFNAGASLTNVNLATQGLDPKSWYGETWSTSNDPSVVRQGNSYAYFRITTDPGMMMTLSDIRFDVRPHGSGPRAFFVDVVDLGLQTSSMLGGIFQHSDQTETGTSDLPSTYDSETSTRKPWNNVTSSSGDYQNLVGTFEIRVYGYNAPQANREVLVDNMILQGSVTPIPEPSTYALLALAGLAFAVRRRSRR